MCHHRSWAAASCCFHPHVPVAVFSRVDLRPCVLQRKWENSARARKKLPRELKHKKKIGRRPKVAGKNLQDLCFFVYDGSWTAGICLQKAEGLELALALCTLERH